MSIFDKVKHAASTLFGSAPTGEQAYVQAVYGQEARAQQRDTWAQIQSECGDDVGVRHICKCGMQREWHSFSKYASLNFPCHCGNLVNLFKYLGLERNCAAELLCEKLKQLPIVPRLGPKKPPFVEAFNSDCEVVWDGQKKSDPKQPGFGWVV